MGKFMYALIMVVIIEVGLLFFGGVETNRTILTEMILNPFGVSGSIFYTTVILVLVAGFSASAIVAGNTFSWGLYGVYAAGVAVIVTFGLSLAHLASFINTNLEGILEPALTQFIIAIIVGPLFIYYFIAALEWIRSNT